MGIFPFARLLRRPGPRDPYVGRRFFRPLGDLRAGLMQSLRDIYGDVHTDANVMVTATHTHAAPTNASWRTLYNPFNGVAGFDQLNYDRVVAGIVESIVIAHDRLAPARIRLARGPVEGAAHNRSSAPYELNVDAADYDSNVDDTMTLLRVTAEDGTDIGLVNCGVVFRADDHGRTATRAGRSRRSAADGIEEVVVAAIANAYNHYMVTREEYEAQHLEGAFTHFGPFSHAAYLQEMDRVAGLLAAGLVGSRSIVPADLSGDQLVHTQIDETGVVNDGPGLTGYGSIAVDVDPTYPPGSGPAAATLWSGHPRNVVDLARSGELANHLPAGAPFSYVEVERQDGADWVTVATDASSKTTFRWPRVGLNISPESNVTVTFDLDGVEPGTYRLVHHGIAKETLVGLLPRYFPYTGTSSEFVVD